MNEQSQDYSFMSPTRSIVMVVISSLDTALALSQYASLVKLCPEIDVVVACPTKSLTSIMTSGLKQYSETRKVTVVHIDVWQSVANYPFTEIQDGLINRFEMFAMLIERIRPMIDTDQVIFVGATVAFGSSPIVVFDWLSTLRSNVTKSMIYSQVAWESPTGKGSWLTLAPFFVLDLRDPISTSYLTKIREDIDRLQGLKKKNYKYTKQLDTYVRDYLLRTLWAIPYVVEFKPLDPRLGMAPGAEPKELNLSRASLSKDDEGNVLINGARTEDFYVCDYAQRPTG